MREAANANQLRRNFEGSTLLRIPQMYWDYCRRNVLVMEWVNGIPIGQTERMRAVGIDLEKLSRDGVEIFFTQVFRDGFFHADMHPGNILVGTGPDDFNRYIALDFGIVGTLSEHDKRYLAQNFLAFFRRDYRRVAELHIESGWVPPDTRAEELEGAVRACCEPVFDRPLREISLGVVLMRLFQASRRFNVESSRSWCCCRRRCSTSRGWAANSTPTSTCGSPHSPFWKCSSSSRWAGPASTTRSGRRRPAGRSWSPNCRGCCTAP